MAVGRCHMCLLFLALFLILVSLALIVTCVVTDFWYEADGTAKEIVNDTIKRNFSYRFGMWRKCYTQGVPIEVAPEDRQGDCQFTYKHFIKREESAMSYADWKYLNLERSWVGLLISSAAIQLFTVLALICGLWPGDCNPIKKVTLYVIAAVFSLLAAMCGIAGCICFIALRDIDITSNNIYPDKVTHRYSWSFMLAWIGTGLCIVEGFLFICLLRMDYDDVGESNKHKIYSPM
ncbi:hypothetical protein ACJMK2_034981 [Sinanodonta woodiana]|uniref:Uncharacterized protein n=1 Tax=Sinanodonta woodiana TaxID=1069815 RepID=A0ABD3WVH8_SINWO